MTTTTYAYSTGYSTTATIAARAEGVSKTYGEGDATVFALDDVSVGIQGGVPFDPTVPAVTRPKGRSVKDRPAGL